jgi:putative DNA primase/helicase
MEQLCQARFAGNFIDKIANIDREIPRDLTGYEDALKKIISGEAVTVDTKFIPSYDAFPYCKIIFAANDMPHISDTSDALFRRMLLLDFNNVIEKQSMDVELKEKIKKEAAGIFNWAFEGLRRLRENNKFTESLQVLENINELKLQNNTVFYFINECFDFVPVSEEGNNYIQIDVLYEKYKDFCHKVGGKGIFKKVVFGKEIKKVFGKQIITSSKWINNTTHRVWLGLKEKNSVSTASDAGVIGWGEE